jgi:hypothetical protein
LSPIAAPAVLRWYEEGDTRLPKTADSGWICSSFGASAKAGKASLLPDHASIGALDGSRERGRKATEHGGCKTCFLPPTFSLSGPSQSPPLVEGTITASTVSSVVLASDYTDSHVQGSMYHCWSQTNRCDILQHPQALRSIIQTHTEHRTRVLPTVIKENEASTHPRAV